MKFFGPGQKRWIFQLLVSAVKQLTDNTSRRTLNGNDVRVIFSCGTLTWTPWSSFNLFKDPALPIKCEWYWDLILSSRAPWWPWFRRFFATTRLYSSSVGGPPCRCHQVGVVFKCLDTSLWLYLLIEDGVSMEPQESIKRKALAKTRCWRCRAGHHGGDGIGVGISSRDFDERSLNQNILNILALNKNWKSPKLSF